MRKTWMEAQATRTEQYICTFQSKPEDTVVKESLHTLIMNMYVKNDFSKENTPRIWCANHLWFSDISTGS